MINRPVKLEDGVMSRRDARSSAPSYCDEDIPT
jgi:hypothetical protein